MHSLGALVAESVEEHPTGVTEVLGSNPAEDFGFSVVLFPGAEQLVIISTVGLK